MGQRTDCVETPGGFASLRRRSWRATPNPFIARTELTLRNAQRIGELLGKVVGKTGVAAFDRSDHRRTDAGSCSQLRLREPLKYTPISGVSIFRFDVDEVGNRSAEGLDNTHKDVDLRRLTAGFPLVNGLQGHVGDPTEVGAGETMGSAKFDQARRLEATQHTSTHAHPFHRTAYRFPRHHALPLLTFAHNLIMSDSFRRDRHVGVHQTHETEEGMN